MGLPVLLKKIFESDGYGPKLNRSVIPFAASPASASPSDVASAGWVKDLVDAEVYVDASVSSSGDGLTSAAAVKTIAEGIELLKQYPSGSGFRTRLHIAGGTYNETVNFQNIKCDIDLSGNVTINGVLAFNYFAGTIGTDSSTTLTVGSIDIGHESYTWFNCKVTVSSNSRDGVVIYHHSYCQFDADISVTANSHNGIMVGGHSSLYINANVSVSAGIGFACYDYGLLYIKSSSCSVNASSKCCDFSNRALAWLLSTTITLTSSGSDVLAVGNTSICYINSFTNFTVTNSAPGTTFCVAYHSLLIVTVAAGKTFSVNRNVTGSCFLVSTKSRLTIYGTGSVSFSGKSTITAHCTYCSNFEFANTLNVSGSFSAGKRYDVGALSLIDTGGAGANRFPGTTAGSISTKSGYYS